MLKRPFTLYEKTFQKTEPRNYQKRFSEKMEIIILTILIYIAPIFLPEKARKNTENLIFFSFLETFKLCLLKK